MDGRTEYGAPRKHTVSQFECEWFAQNDKRGVPGHLLARRPVEEALH